MMARMDMARYTGNGIFGLMMVMIGMMIGMMVGMMGMLYHGCRGSGMMGMMRLA